MRQMLLTWNPIDYYNNGYAVNQYLASRGFSVLSVNYRSGVNYGHDFHYAVRTGWTGASEYQDVLAGARWLQRQHFVDANRIGIWGGSWGRLIYGARARTQFRRFQSRRGLQRRA